MSGGGLSSPFGANANPFEGSEGKRAETGGNAMQIIEEDENDTVTSPTSTSFAFALKAGPGGAAFRGPFGGDAAPDAASSSARSPPNPESYPLQYNFARRTSVSAESLKPAADTYDNWQPPSHPKTAEQLGRLKHAIEGNFLFSHLDDEQSAQILGALVEKPIPARDIKVRSHNLPLLRGRSSTRRGPTLIVPLSPR